MDLSPVFVQDQLNDLKTHYMSVALNRSHKKCPKFTELYLYYNF